MLCGYHFQTPVYETDFILGPNRIYVFLSKSLFIVGSKVGNWDAETVKFEREFQSTTVRGINKNL